MLLSSPPAVGDAFDLCVVGAGPVGLALSLEAARLGLRVLVIEAGRDSPARGKSVHRLNGNIVNAAHHAPVAEVTAQAIGGTSWLWGGRCVPFEPIDFERRAYVPHSGWPVSAEEIARWHPIAAAYLDCGDADFREEAQRWQHLGDVELSQLERWSRHPKRGRPLGARVIANPRIALLANTTVQGIVFASDGDRVDHLTALDEHGRPVSISAADFVIACGGLATTQLLLSAHARHPERFGGAGGPLGRYYMGHITGSIANIQLADPDDVRDLDFHRDSRQTYVRRRFTFSPTGQRSHRLLNTSFYIGNPPFHDHRHRSPTLSLIVLAMAMPLVGRCFASSASRAKHLGAGRVSLLRHVGNVLRRPWQGVAELASVVRLRYLAAIRRPVFVARNPSGEYAVRYHAEQVPNAESRVWLNDEAPPGGIPDLDIDFRYSPQDVESVLKAHAVLDEHLRAAGRGRLRYLHREDDLRSAVMAQALDGYHQIGTTRMSSNPAEGVVDENCRVHGVANLHLASSSCFPTAGEANPTFMAVCLGVRLAHRLAGQSPSAG